MKRCGEGKKRGKKKLKSSDQRGFKNEEKGDSLVREKKKRKENPAHEKAKTRLPAYTIIIPPLNPFNKMFYMKF